MTDEDRDNDGVPDAMDNCPDAPNESQLNTDHDNLGDACDRDIDGDNVADKVDNCAGIWNYDQHDTDGDKLGDACDGDVDGDGVANAADTCPAAANQDQADLDHDGRGDACDADDDGDDVLDEDDNCGALANIDQRDSDDDGLGDACDPDDDNDKIADDHDNCPLAANPEQSNLDADAAGDACDDDADGDGVANAADNCPSIANAEQADDDGDKRGDACEGVLTPSVASLMIGGHIASAGGGFAGRTELVSRPEIRITLGNIPTTGTVRRAFLYWTVIGAPFPTVKLDGTAITGIEIGQAADTCAGIGNNFAYRADVTPLVHGNGTYTLTNLISTIDHRPDGQGASLIVIYSDSADARLNFVGINDGAVGLVGPDATSTSRMTGFTLAAGFDKITTTNLVAGGGRATDSLLVEGHPVGTADAFAGAQGALWDNRIDDATSLAAAGVASIAQRIVGGGDCLAWSMSGLVIEDVDGDPKPAPGR